MTSNGAKEATAANDALPLAGVRLLDLTTFWAGPIAAQLFADLGAEVIKIEALQKLDPWRAMFARATQEQSAGPESYETSATFVAVHRNKLELTLNLKDPGGVEAFEDLVRVSDVVLENYSPRVMEQFGLDYTRLREVNEAIVVTSLSGFGHSGPWRDYVSFASVAESLAGITDLLGYDGEPPLIDGSMPSDPAGGFAAVIGTLLALEEVRRSGEGRHVDVSQFEGTVPLLADAFMDWALLGCERTRGTNHSTWQAPHGVYRAAGEDRWISISAGSEDEWQGLVAALDQPDLAQDARFATLEARLEHGEALDARLTAWTSERDPDEATALLQRHGVPAMPVLSPRLLLEDEHYAARHHFQSVARSYGGDWPQAVAPLRLNGEQLPLRLPAPLLGEHNDYVLRELLDYDDARIQALISNGTIGRQPAWREGERD